MNDDDAAGVIGFVLLLVFLEYIVIAILAVAVMGMISFGLWSGFRTWRKRARLRTVQRGLEREHWRVIQQRNAAIRDVIRVRQAAERRMREITRGDVIDADSWEDR
jgi:hypothetical protein